MLITGPPRSASEGVLAVNGGIELPCEYLCTLVRRKQLTCKNTATVLTEYSEVEKNSKVTVKTKTKVLVPILLIFFTLLKSIP